MKPRPILLLAAVLASLAVLSACGEGDESGSGEIGPGSDPATLAPPRSPLFVEAVLRPSGELKANVQALAKQVAGVGDLGELIVSELESSAGESGEELDFDAEVAPWLGERGGVFFRDFDGEDFQRYGIAIQTADAEASQEFIDGRRDGDAEDGSYKGIEYATESDDGTTVGVIDDFVAIAEDEATFKAMVDASDGESLAGEERYTETVDAATEGSLADAYVDVGGLVDRSGDAIDPEAQQFLDAAGIEPAGATAVASLVPDSDQVEIELTSNLGGENPPSGDASRILGELPGDATFALALPDFGDRLGEALDEIDANGIPGEIPRRKFKSTLKEAGIDVDEIASAVGDVAAYAEGEDEDTLEGAALLEVSSAAEARSAVSGIGLLLRASGTPGFSAISDEFTGFSIRDPEELGDKPLVFGAKGKNISIGYGLRAATKAFTSRTVPGGDLAASPIYEEATKALGGTPLSGLVHGPSAVFLISNLVAGSDDEDDFKEAEPYLEKISYLALGSTSSGEEATARVIVGVEK